MKIKLLFVAILSLLVFSGCSSTTEIDHRSIVHAVGVDKNEQGYEVSLQIFSPSGSGSDTPVDVSKSNTKVVSAVGETIYDGMKGCEKLLGGEAFMGHNKFIIFGSSLYGEDMDRLLGWFRKENENYLGVTVGYSESTAKEILDIKLTDGASAVENMELIHSYAVKNGTTAQGDLLVLFNDLALTTKSGFLPVFSVKDKEKSDNSDKEEPEQYLEIKKTAILKGGVVAGFLNSDEVMGVLWLNGEIDKCKVTVEIDGGFYDVELESKWVFPKIYKEGEKLVASFDINAEARVVEELSSDIKRRICEYSQQKILESCRKAIKKTVEYYRTDVLRIEKLIKFYKPSIFRQYSDDFERVLTSVEFKAEVNCKIAN